MRIDKDIYEYLTNFLDDKTILSMYSVNKKFRSDEYSERLMKRKYPLICDFKKFNKTWRSLFIRMARAISKLEKDYGIPYIPTKKYNPEYLLTNEKSIFFKARCEAVKGGHLDILIKVLDKNENLNEYNTLLQIAAIHGHINILNFLIEKGYKEILNAILGAVHGGHLDILKLLVNKTKTTPATKHWNLCMLKASKKGFKNIISFTLEKGAINFDECMIEAARIGDIDIINLMISKGATSFQKTLDIAAKFGQKEVVLLMLTKGVTDFDKAILESRNRGHIYIENLLLYTYQNLKLTKNKNR